MITGIAIENFKGIRDRVQIELKPITLLFGPNSAGKSTILHALHYAREVFAHHNLDADSTSAGAQFVDLGGFHNLVHGHDARRQLMFRLSFQIQADKFLVHQHDAVAWEELLGLDTEEAKELVSQPSSGAVELKIAWSNRRGHPYVARCLIQLEEVDFAEITATDDQVPEVTLRLIRPDHPVLKSAEMEETKAATLVGEESSDYTGDSSVATSQPSILHLALRTVASRREDSPDPYSFRLVDQMDALPVQGATIGFADRPLKIPTSWHAPIGGPGAHRRPKAITLLIAAGESTTIVGCLVTAVLRSLRAHLERFRYLGPMREIPPRNSAPPRSPDPNRWSTGLGAWDLLQTGENVLVRSVSDWLQSPKHLDAGVRLERVTWAAQDKARRSFVDLPQERRLYLVPNDRDVRLTPHDVGVGISQIVPVLVAALDKQACLDVIEEPGYHLHPRLQAELGDLLLEGTRTGGKQFLIETHSEHLVLRLQRRIRATTRKKPPPQFHVTTSDVAVYFVYREEGQTRSRRIDLDQDGEFVQPWPDDLFEVDFYERFG